MAIVTKGGRKRQTILIIVLIILAVIVGVYVYSTRKPASTKPEAMPPEAAVPEALAPEVKAVRPEALSLERINKILKKLKDLDLVLRGKLPIKVDPKEIGRANPFIAP